MGSCVIFEIGSYLFHFVRYGVLAAFFARENIP